MNPETMEAVRHLAEHVESERREDYMLQLKSAHNDIGQVEGHVYRSALVALAYLDDVEVPHEPRVCSVNSAARYCRNEARHWYEEPKEPYAQTFYLCDEHMPEDADGSDASTIENSTGATVEIARYACSDDCGVCND